MAGRRGYNPTTPAQGGIYKRSEVSLKTTHISAIDLETERREKATFKKRSDSVH